MRGKNFKIFVAGHKGLVGSAIVRKLKEKNYKKIITIEKSKLALTNQLNVLNFLKRNKPEFIFIAAAKVGGIYSNNKFKADFIYSNLAIQSNIIHSAYKCGINNLIFLGSSCVYPRNCKQPIKEDYLLSGKLEQTNDAYAIAKIAGIKMCESYNQQYGTNFKCLMPTNTFGKNDNYHDLNSHFVPALIKKIHKIKTGKSVNLKIWGNGKAKRELIYVDDVADACVFFMKKKIRENIINIGSGKDLSIKEYARLFLKILCPEKKVKLIFDKRKPNGTPRKVMDVSLAANYGWRAKSSLRDSIIQNYKSYLSSFNDK